MHEISIKKNCDRFSWLSVILFPFLFIVSAFIVLGSILAISIFLEFYRQWLEKGVKKTMTSPEVDRIVTLIIYLIGLTQSLILLFISS